MTTVGIRGTGDLSLIPGADSATTQQREFLAELVGIIEAAKNALGLSRVYVTSWLGGVHTTKVHETGAAIDFTAGTKEDTFALWLWVAQNRRDQIGEVIYEQPETGNTGHVHMTLPGFGGNGQVLYEQTTGGFVEPDPFLFRHIGSDRDSRTDGDGEPEQAVVTVVVGSRRFAGSLSVES